MLNALREKTQGLMGAALLVVLVVPFVLWGVSSYFGGGSTVYVARGRGLRITEPAFQIALARQRVAFERAFGKSLNPAVLSSQRFKKAVLEGLINKTLLLRNARKSGYATNQTTLAEEIRQIPAFRVKGHFSLTRYRAVLAGEGFTVSRFERQVRDLTLLNQVKVGLLASAFVPTPELQQAAALLGQKRSIAYVVLSPRPFEKTIRVTSTDVQQYYAAHSQDFRLPQKIRIAYVLLSPQAVMRHMHAKIGMRALQKAYQSHIQDFTQPAQRLVRHIMIALPLHPTAAQIAQAKSKLETIRSEIQHGAHFGLLAKRYSEDTSSAAAGGSLGYVTQSELSKPVGKAAFALPLDHVSAPVVGQSGVHLLEVMAVRPAKVVPFAAVRSQLVRMVMQSRARKRLYHLSERLRNAAFEHPHSLGPAAHKLGLTLHESGWFGRTGGHGIAALPQVVKAVFAPKVLAGRRNTHAIPLGEDATLVAHVVARKTARTEPLAMARPMIIKRIRRERAAALVKRKETLLLRELQKGASLAAVAHQMGLVVTAPAAFALGATGLPRALVKAVYSTRPPGRYPQPGVARLGGGRLAVFVVRKVIMGQVNPTGPRFVKLEQSFTNDVGVETYLAYIKSLREKAHIHIHAGAL